MRSDFSSGRPVFQVRREDLLHQLLRPLRNPHVQLRRARRCSSSASAAQYSVFDSQLSAMMRLE